MANLIYQLKNFYKEIDFPYRNYMDRHKCIFIHIPKAAGTSILDALGKKDADSRRDHVPFYIYNKANAHKFKTYYKFSFVRNPWDRAFSAYNYIMQGGNNKIDLAIRQQLEMYKGFDDFVINGLGKGKFRNLLLFLPQSQFVLGFDQKIAMDFLGKYENIEEDFAIVAKHLKLKKALPVRNQNKKSEEVKYETQEAIDVIRNIYMQDISNFDYRFEP